MTKPSVFRDFMMTLKSHWRRELPSISPTSISHERRMPKASTFYVGVAGASRLHVFVNFQHSCMAWQVGQFTVNIILSRRNGPPHEWAGPFAPDDGVSFSEGSYRISSLLGRWKDKWWHLKLDDDPIGHEAWRPSTYEDYNLVLNEAVADVTRNVLEALRKLGVLIPVSSG